MFRRVAMMVVSGVEDVARILDEEEPGLTLIFDVDNTVARQGASSIEVDTAVNDAIDRFEAHAAVDRAIALTNGPQRGVTRMIGRGNKPWTTRRRLGLVDTVSIVVVGDQVLTDGMLAWRLGATFLHLALDDQREAPRQALMRRVGSWVTSLFFQVQRP